MDPWYALGAAIALEVIGTTSLKLSDGFSRPLPSVLVVVCYAGAFAALAHALRRLDVGVAYAVWSGVGTAVIAAVGILVYRESATALKLTSLALILLGVVGLHLSTAQR
jgi:small multidrug resistance pump